MLTFADIPGRIGLWTTFVLMRFSAHFIIVRQACADNKNDHLVQTLGPTVGGVTVYLWEALGLLVALLHFIPLMLLHDRITPKIFHSLETRIVTP